MSPVRFGRGVSRAVSSLLILAMLVSTTGQAFAQRMGHSAPSRSSRPAPSAASASRGSQAKPSSASRQAPAAAPATASRPSINGGNQRTPDRAPSGAPKSGSKASGAVSDRQDGPGDRGAGGRGGDGKVDIKGGDKVNIGSGNTNVNINVDNSRNTTVRRNTNINYNRPPYYYGGHRYYCYHPYYYHPYRPFYWGPVWHPWGFFVATLAVTAVVVSVNSQQYHYDQGVFYAPSSGGYTVVQAPVGATVTTIPSNSQTVVVNNTTNNYYYGGAFYEKGAGGYTVVPPTAGTVVESLPEGGEEVKIGDQTYVKFGETYYQPIQRDGKNMYEVVLVEEGEK